MKVVCSMILLFLAFATVNAQKVVTYRIEYNSDNEACAGNNPAPLTINSSYTSTAMDIMELARDEGDEYQFSATYFGFLGYFIDEVNGRSGDNGCFWFFYIQETLESSAFKPQIGVTTYVPGNNFIVILRYETFRQPAMFSSTLSIEYPEPMCSTDIPPSDAQVSVLQGGTALDVMEQAGNMGRDYRFSATYFGSDLGFLINTLNGNTNNATTNCNWIYFIMNPDGSIEQATVGVSNYVIPADGYTIIWRYNMQNMQTFSAASPVEETDSEKTVTYRIEYNSDSPACSGTNLAPLTIRASSTSTAMDIMELARDEGSDYQFSATYFGASIGGYFIDSVNGRSGDNGCFWFFYIEAPGASAFKPQIGVTTYVPGNDFAVILRYETFRQPAMFSSTLRIEYPEPTCSTATPPPDVTVSIFQGGNALDVMEQAGNMGSEYRFSATYFGTSLGFFIDTLNGTSSDIDNNCFWIYYIMTPDGNIFEAEVGVSSYVIPDDGYAIIWRYIHPVTTAASQVAKGMNVLIVTNLLLVMFVFKFYYY